MRHAILSEQVEYRVFGPPGTGKTTYLSRQIKRAAETTDQIMVASFTRAAAIEIAGRGLTLPKWRVGTLHSFCFRVLGRPEIAETPKWFKKYNEHQPAHMHLNGGRNLDDPYQGVESGQTVADRHLAKYGRLRTQQVPKSSTQWDQQLLTWVKGWEEFKKEHELLDFTDLITKSLEVAEAPPFSCEIGFFDEVQDFSPAELALVRKWGSHFGKIILGGDDDQTIYNFRGSIPEAFLDPPLPEEFIKLLKKSHRLPRVIKEKADAWIKSVERRQEKPFEALKDGGEVHVLGVNHRAPNRVLLDAVSMADGGETVMILATCGIMLWTVIDGLRDLGVPFHNPYRPTNGLWNPWRGGIDRLRAYLTDNIELHGGLTEEHTWASVWRWAEFLNAKKTGMPRGCKRYLKDYAKDTRKQNDPLTPADWKNFRLRPPEGNLEWLQEHLLETKQKTMSYAFRVARCRGVRTLAVKPRICVGTIHSVKGGEADNVFLFPDISLAAVNEVLVPGPDDSLLSDKQKRHRQRAARDALRRLWYVGMTRARKQVFFCSAAQRDRSIVTHAGGWQ